MVVKTLNTSMILEAKLKSSPVLDSLPVTLWLVKGYYYKTIVYVALYFHMLLHASYKAIGV